MTQQTAVEWLFQQLWDEPKDKFTWYAIREKAIQMEKEQIENARPQITSNCVIKEIADDEIKYAAYKDKNVNIGMEPESAFIDGAKWYREQLKSKQ